MQQLYNQTLMSSKKRKLIGISVIAVQQELSFQQIRKGKGDNSYTTNYTFEHATQEFPTEIGFLLQQDHIIVCFHQFVSSPMFYAFTCIGLLFKALQQRYKRYYTTHVLENINNKQYELEEQKRMFSNLDPSLSSCASLVSQATHTFINP